ncbi:MAG: phosphotransferase, partial [Gemmatimonadetes bacterium]|nr:phosphotransferase [Gemmatimonadota bacterium]
MKAFADLTWRGQSRRLRHLALQALRLYELEVDRVSWVSRWTNDILRVRTRDGAVYALRLCCPGWRTREDLLLEVAWLEALQRDVDLNTPRIVHSRDGSPFVEVGGEDGAEPRRCFLVHWSRGIRLGLRLTEANLYKMGNLFAQLHAHGVAFVQPSGLPVKKMDGVYVRGGEEILLDALHRAKVAPRIMMLFERTIEKVDAAFAQRYADPAGFRVIHNDLHHDNINLYRGRLYP